MRIGLNLLSLHSGQAGVRVFSINLVSKLVDLWPEAEFIFYVTKDGLAELDGSASNLIHRDNVKVMLFGFDPKNKARLLAIENTLLVYRLIRHGIDFLVSLDYHAPIAFRKSSIVIHDVNYIDTPELVSRSYGCLRKVMVPLSIGRAARVWTISAFTYSRLERVYPRWVNKISVIGSGVDAKPVECHANSRCDAYGDYILSVGSFGYNKNHISVVRAFKKLDWDGKLVIVGKKGPALDEPEMNELRDELGSKLILLTDGVSDEELRHLYVSARAYITASLYEGFGLTILEAMAHQVPVVSSCRASLPVIGGRACLYFNPEKEEEIVAALSEVLFNEDVRKRMIGEGRSQISMYSWERVASNVKSEIESYFSVKGLEV